MTKPMFPFTSERLVTMREREPAIVTDEGSRSVRTAVLQFGQDVNVPAVQDADAEEGRQIRRFMFKEQVTGSLVE
jgi:hypothetical protein